MAIEAAEKLDLPAKLKLAGIALEAAKVGGASYADFRLCRYQTEYLECREHRLEESSAGISAGFAVRVLLDGTWGYASSPLATEEEVRRVARACPRRRQGQPASANAQVRPRGPPRLQRQLGHADEGRPVRRAVG